MSCFPVSPLVAYRWVVLAAPFVLFGAAWVWSVLLPGPNDDMAKLVVNIFPFLLPVYLIYIAVWWRVTCNGLSRKGWWVLAAGPVAVVLMICMLLFGMAFWKAAAGGAYGLAYIIQSLKGFAGIVMVAMFLGLPIGYGLLAFIFVTVWLGRKLGLVAEPAAEQGSSA